MSDKELLRRMFLGATPVDDHKEPAEHTRRIEAWNPGLDNDASKLGDVLATLPGDRPEDVPLIVKAFENPKSPIAFHGAIDLHRHDCVHILLGRGLLPCDEAFVIGFTMGTARGISRIESWLYERIGKYVYRGQYSFTEDDLQVYRLGLETGKTCPVKEINKIPFELMHELDLGTIRSLAKIDKSALREVYRRERELLPTSWATERLPVEPKRTGEKSPANGRARGPEAG